jgi:methylated-DNA-[protein]-cysteine S-methyltransferase
MYYDFFKTRLIGRLTLVGEEEGLRHIVFQEDKNPVSIQEQWERRPEFFEEVKAQLQAYFKREREQFDLPMAPVGTPFQRKVWQVLRAIPYGNLVNYKSIAEALGNPKAVRAVGRAIGQNPIPIIIPCHRVVGSDGSLTGFGGGLETKKRLINLERAWL